MNHPFGAGNLDQAHVMRVQQDVSVHWDLSKKPKTNDRVAKRGAGLAARGGAVDLFDDQARRFKFYDGSLRRDGSNSGEVPGHQVSLWGDEPDNWVLRFHDEDGDGDLSTWAHRLIADHTHKSSEAKNRGTMIVDQADSQLWGYLHDIAQIVEPSGGDVDAELRFNGAGILTLLDHELGEGAAKRGAVSTPIYKNGGFINDLGRVGQWQHLITFAPTSGSATGGRPSITVEALLRADVGFRRGNDVFRLEPESLPPSATDGSAGEEIRIVHFCPIGPGTADDGNGPGEDPNSNFKTIPKGPKSKLGGWVRVPFGVEEGDIIIEDYSYHSDPPPDDDDYTGGSGGKTPSTPADDGEQPDGNPAVDADGNPLPNTPTTDPFTNPTDHCSHGTAELE